ncbi:MAG: HD domain-containing protein [Patescibacteria group bacterium]
MTKTQILKKTEIFARAEMSELVDTSHDFSHVLRVKVWAEKIALSEGLDKFKMQMVALLHDIGQGKENYEKGLLHAEMSEIIARPFLEGIKEISLEDRDEILEAIKRHGRGDKNDKPLTKAFKDADRLDCVGTLSILRATIFCHDLPICNSLKSFADKKVYDPEEIAQFKKAKKPMYNDIVGAIIWNNNNFHAAMFTKTGKSLEKPFFEETNIFLRSLKKRIKL